MTYTTYGDYSAGKLLGIHGSASRNDPGGPTNRRLHKSKVEFEWRLRRRSGSCIHFIGHSGRSKVDVVTPLTPLVASSGYTDPATDLSLYGRSLIHNATGLSAINPFTGGTTVIAWRCQRRESFNARNQWKYEVEILVSSNGRRRFYDIGSAWSTPERLVS
ncbi:hypothetical protein CVT26_016156 [Gymnopilus dilepis]|uniref:Uncharacterized protein n=1 Tax=Gymnopilus dilepis TaxID=231916 RepID=A0A409XYX4_9AGAR|nr:hypothetical protein CVT26_016156 [Gymnopilus dilepis]